MEITNGSNVESISNEADEHDGGIRIGDIYIPPPPLAACSFDTKGPRLMITRIENINFKSYAAHQELGPLHKNFTAIIGPNGSGKSNVIDAMLFVFGYRAKKIRSNKVGVLIHNSDKYPNLESCTVKVHFQMITDKGDHDYDVLPDSKFCIGRTAFRDNSSVYEIDGRRVQFKQVSKLLRSYGIDLDHNRFLILQGEIEMIAMMKAKGVTENECGMLEYLEDIVGSNRFIEPIQKFALRVEELNELRTEKLNRVKLAENEKEEIEAEKNEAVEYLQLENKIIIKNNTVLQVQLRDAKSELDIANENKEETKKEFEILSVALEELKHNRSLKDDECASIRTEYEKCVSAVEDCNEKYSALEREDVACRDNISNFKGKLKKLIKSLEAEEVKLVDLKKMPEVHDGEVGELTKKKEMLEVRRVNEEKKLEEVMGTMKVETVGLQEEKDKHESKLIGLKKIVNETKSQMDIAQSELDAYLRNANSAQTRLDELQEKLKDTASSIDEKNKLHEDAESRIPSLQTKIAKFKTLLTDLTDKEKKVSQEILTNRMKLEEAKTTFQNSKNRGVMLQSLMQQKDSGAIPGIFGRLGDLGGIDEKYDVAISTACGSLDNIVTDTIATAQKCVEYLKHNNKGYAKFIALDKMNTWEHHIKRPFSAPENVPRLFDLVKVKDTRVLPAFYFALRDTLVTNDLDQATRIGLHGRTRYRCVTLKGDLIDLAGTMSGGGGRALRGRMGRSVTASETNPQEMEKMSQHFNELVKVANQLREEKGTIEDSINKMQLELNALLQALKKNTVELKALKESQVVIAKEIPAQKKKVQAAAPDKARVKELQSVLENKKSSYEKANSNAVEVKKKVESLHEEIVKITKGKFGSVQNTVNKLKKEIDAIEAGMTKCKVASSTAKRNQKKAEDKIENLQTEINEVKQSREKLMSQFKELETRATEVLQKKQNAEKEMSACEEKRKIMMKDVDAIKQQELKLKSEKIELKNKLKNKEDVVKEKSDVIKILKSKVKQLKLQVIDEENEQVLALPTLTLEEMDPINVNALMYEIGLIETEMRKMKPNMAAISEFRIKEALYKKKVAELEGVSNERDEMKSHHDNLRKQRLEEFMKGFQIITAKVKEVYQMITLGGDAELDLADSLDPFTEGINFSVRPPKKSWKPISNLSGGEKTLSSLALVFALHYYKPTPFYVMDEIDAALDFKNVSIVGNYIKERTKNAQFIIISLRNNMFELSDRLVGIYKTYNCTKSATISPYEYGEDDEVENNENEALNTQ